jgi:hypothetical protein
VDIVAPDASLKDAMLFMCNRGYRRLPVVDSDAMRLLRIVVAADVVRRMRVKDAVDALGGDLGIHGDQRSLLYDDQLHNHGSHRAHGRDT